MKTIFWKIVLVVLVIISTVACKKEKNLDTISKPVKRIQTGNDLYNYVYNSDGKVSEVNLSKLNGSNFTATDIATTQFNYNSDEIIIRQVNQNDSLLTFNTFLRQNDRIYTPDSTVNLQINTRYQSNATLVTTNYLQYIDVLSGLLTSIIDSFIYIDNNLYERVTYSKLGYQNNFTNIAYYKFEAGSIENNLNYFLASEAEMPLIPDQILRGGFSKSTAPILGFASKNTITNIKKYSSRNGNLLEEISNTYTTDSNGLITTKVESKNQNNITVRNTTRFEY